MKKTLFALILLGLTAQADTYRERALKLSAEVTCKTILRATNPQLDGLLLSADTKTQYKKGHLVTAFKFNNDEVFMCVYIPYGASIRLTEVGFLDAHSRVISDVNFRKLQYSINR